MYHFISGSAFAALLTLITAFPANAAEGDWLVRARLINVNPNDDSGAVTGIAGSGVDVDAGPTLDIDITYMVKNNIGVELLLDLSSKHDINGSGSIAALGTVAEVSVLPPSLIAQYHFMPAKNIRPYAGIGINYTLFFDESTSASLNTALGNTTIELDDSFGYVIQFGADYDINEEWFANIDIKYIDLDTTATLNTGGSIATVDVDLNPIVFGIGVGKRF